MFVGSGIDKMPVKVSRYRSFLPGAIALAVYTASIIIEFMCLVVKPFFAIVALQDTDALLSFVEG